MTIPGIKIEPIGLTRTQLRKANIGEDYWEVDFDQYKGPRDPRILVYKYLQELSAYKSRGEGFLLAGHPGTGKTTLLAIALKYLVRSNWGVYMTSLSDLIELIKRSWDDKDLVTDIDHLKHIDFLGLDDLGKEHRGPTGFTSVTFDNLLRYRVQHRLPTLLTSNLNRTEIKERYGEATLSLIEGKTRIIAVNGSDYRQYAARQLKQ